MTLALSEQLYNFIQDIDYSEHHLPISELATKYIIHKDSSPAS